MVRTFLAWATKLHWFVGLVAALVLFVVLILVLKWIQNAQLTSKEFGKYPRIGLALNLFMVIFLAIVLLATVSGILYQQNLVQYSPETKNPITISLLLDYYSWHFIDSIPIFKILSILKQLSFSLDVERNDIMIFRGNKFPFQRITVTKDEFISVEVIEIIAQKLDIDINVFLSDDQL